ncbi:hypothetical protein [Roseiflexus sp.]|uniref:hypothetical protein n=1 Tax=Roseiflexus sp. TaxID=2562120 RepID=UPI0021DDCDA5|nr:hypothetical protein [Roseiflexus sp.]GIW00364.1 MAG: hypothetical protein KatS3mg058_1767 [Roseiflexus sp.]
MSAPRIEALLVSLVVLVAAGVALAAAYAPPIPRQSPVELRQESSHKNESPADPPARMHNADRQAAFDIVLLVDRVAQSIDRTAVDERIALLVIGGVASLILAIVVVRRQRQVATRQRSVRVREEAEAPSCEHPEEQRFVSTGKWGVIVWQWSGSAWRCTQTWISAARCIPMLPGEIRALQYARGVLSQWRYEQHSSHLPDFAPVSAEEGRPVDQTADAHRSMAMLQCSGSQSAPDTDLSGGRDAPPPDTHLSGGRDAPPPDTHLSDGRDAPPPDTHLSDGRDARAPGNAVLPAGQDTRAPGNAVLPAGQDTRAPGNAVLPAGRDTRAPGNAVLPGERDTRAPGSAASAALTTDGAAAAVAAVLDMYERQRLTQSKVVFAEANVERQGVRVRLTVAAHPDESRTLAALPDQAPTSMPGARAQWQHTSSAQPVLNVALRGALPAMCGSPMLLPVARHQPIARLPAIHHGTLAVSFLPLRTWRHVGFYGGKAVESASSALVDLLYIEAPETLAVTIIDDGQISSLCAGTPHLVSPPGAAVDSLVTLGRATRFFLHSDLAARQLLIVLVEPDATMLRIYGDLVARLLRHTYAPVYTLLVQTHQPDALWRLPLPAVMTGDRIGRSGNEADQPPPGRVRIVAAHMRIERQSSIYDATRLAALAAVLRSCTGAPLPPTVWDAVAS